MLNPFFKLKTITLPVICLILFFNSFVQAGYWKHGIFWTVFLLILTRSFTTTIEPYKFKNPVDSSVNCLMCFILCLYFYVYFCKIGGISMCEALGLYGISVYGLVMLLVNIFISMSRYELDANSSDEFY